MSDGRDENATAPVCRPRAATEPLGDGRLLVRAPAKLNLALRVGPVRDDGFHPLDSLVVKVTLYDELEFMARDDGRVRLTCDDASIGPVADNLVVRAATAMQARAAGGAGVDIVLRKRIPAGAGLGGGSADAAVTLGVLNELWDCGVAEGPLAAMAAELGSDVPLTLGPPAARMRGRGEILDAATIRPFCAVLITPPVHSPTAAVYRAFDDAAPSALAPLDVSAFATRPASEWADATVNDLYAPACRVCGRIAEWVDAATAATGEAVRMTGSGSALFIAADDLDAAVAIAGRLDDRVAGRARVVSQNSW